MANHKSSRVAGYGAAAPCLLLSRKVPLLLLPGRASAPVDRFPWRCYFDLVHRCPRSVAELRRDQREKCLQCFRNAP